MIKPIIVSKTVSLLFHVHESCTFYFFKALRWYCSLEPAPIAS